MTNNFQEFYLFNEKGVIHPTATLVVLQIATDAITYCPSGIN